MYANDPSLVQLRDRIGLLNSGEPREVLQRLTWTFRTPEALAMINRAIDDVIEMHRD